MSFLLPDFGEALSQRKQQELSEHHLPFVSLNHGVLERMSEFGSLQERPRGKDVSAHGYLGGDVRRHRGSAGSDEGEEIGRLAMRAHAYSRALGNGVDHTSEITQSRGEASGALIHHIPSIIG